ncbi:MAG: NPCBM/NEW2 domain-containing protein [Acidobacteriota bacterium]
MYLDSLSPLEAQVGYGDLGLYGSLGYEGRIVLVQGRTYQHALSTHPPARLLFQTDRRFSRLHCLVALNDDVRANLSYADFIVLADGRPVAVAPYVIAGESPRKLVADISAAQYIELIVNTNNWEFSHAVWLDPQLDEVAVPSTNTLLDCLNRVEISWPANLPSAQRCIATVVSPGFEKLLDDMLGSLYAYGDCPDALKVVFAVDANEECRKITTKYGAVMVPCVRRARVNPTVKSVLYTVSRIIDAEEFICLDADMLVLGDLRPIFDAIQACPEGSIFACREANARNPSTLERAIINIYGGRSSDLARLLGRVNGEQTYPLVVNDGLFAGSRLALLALDGLIRSWTNAIEWVDERRDIWWRNQFIFNLALARMNCGIELDPTYNLQLHFQDVKMHRISGRVAGLWQSRVARVLHFNGWGRNKYPEWRGLFAGVPDPLINGAADFNYKHYDRFLSTLRAWVGHKGTNWLSASLLATNTNGKPQILDSMPLLTLLYQIVRSCGCTRVLETNTGQGILTACLAAAVAYQDNGRVVTFASSTKSEREQLWAALPEEIAGCIEARQSNSITGMSAALEIVECYEVALLDSQYEKIDDIWYEFKHAKQLVCENGWILFYLHWNDNRVEHLTKLIEKEGHRIVHLGAKWNKQNQSTCPSLLMVENSSQHQNIT